MNKSKYKALLIDLDDTLLDFQKAETRAIKKTFKEIGFKYNKKTILSYKKINQGYWEKYELGLIEKKDIFRLRFIDLFKKYDFVCDDVNKVNDMYFSCLKEEGMYLPFAKRFLKKLIVPAYGITNGVKTVQEGRCWKTGIYKYLKKIYISEVIGKSKPDPAFFSYVLSDLNFNKEEVLVIGDSLTSDVKGAKDAGLEVVWYNPRGKEAKMIKPDFIAKTYHEILSFITKPA